MRIVLLTGGDGAGLAHRLASRLDPGDTLDVVVPVTRDHWAHGLKCCPDLDTMLEGAGTDRRRTYEVADELASVGFLPAWMRPSDADVARRIVRTELLHAGYRLTEVAAAMAARVSSPFRLLPVSDDRAEHHVVVEEADGRHTVHVAEFVAWSHAPEPVGATIVAESWSLSPEVLTALDEASVVVLGPSSPATALGPLLATPGLREHLTAPVLSIQRDEPDEASAHVAVGAVDLPATSTVANDVEAVLAAVHAGTGTRR